MKKEGLACGEEVRKDLGLGAGPVERDGVFRCLGKQLPLGGSGRVWGWGMVGSTHGKCPEHSPGRTEKSVLRNFKKIKQKQEKKGKIGEGKQRFSKHRLLSYKPMANIYLIIAVRALSSPTQQSDVSM